MGVLPIHTYGCTTGIAVGASLLLTIIQKRALQIRLRVLGSRAPRKILMTEFMPTNREFLFYSLIFPNGFPDLPLPHGTRCHGISKAAWLQPAASDIVGDTTCNGTRCSFAKFCFLNPSDPFVALLHSFKMAALFIRISQTGL